MDNKLSALTTKNVIVFCLILAVVYIAITSLDIILMLFASFVIVCAVSPLIDRLSKFMPRTLASVLVVLLSILVTCIIIIPLISICVREAIGLAASFTVSFEEIEKFFGIKIFNTPLSDYVTFDAIKDPLTNTIQALVQNAIVAGKSVANFLTTVLAIIIIVFYYVYDEKRIKDKFIEFFPKNQKERARAILESISTRVGNYVVAQGLAMISVGVITTIGLLILGNEHAFLLGTITCVLDIIPVVGPVLATIIGLISAVNLGIIPVILTLCVYLVAQWAENQFVRPIVFSKFLNMHPLLIIISLLLFSRLLGFWGLILAPVIASVICILVDELYLNRINKS